MRIEGSNRSGMVASKRGVRRAGESGSAFSAEAGGEAGEAARTDATVPVQDLGALLALQGVEDPLFARRKAIKRGQSMLDVLDEVKADLVLGRVSEGRLNRLMALVQQAREKSTPELDALIDDIELRARVELAKLGRITKG